MRLDRGQIEVVDEVMAQFLQAKTPLERLAIADGMWRSARQLMTASLHAQHPGWDEAAISAEVSRRLSYGTH